MKTSNLRGQTVVMGLLVTVVLGARVTYGQSAPENAQAAWQTLFDGKSLSGWTPEQGARWHVAGGAIVGDAGGDGWLRSDREFTDFDLKVEFRNSPKGNSGIFLRATRESNAVDPSNPSGGYELQINNEDPTWPTGSIENFIQRLVPTNPASNRWHTYEVEVRGDHLSATLDHVRVLDGHDQRFKFGHIGLQHHRNNKIEFRKILVVPLERRND